MNMFFFISGIMIVILILITIYLNYLDKEKIKIKKLIEFKNFIFSFKADSYLELDKLLYKEKNKINAFGKLKEEIEKIIFIISQDKIYIFNEVWATFIYTILQELKLNNYEIEIKENLLLFGNLINNADDNEKNQILRQIISKLDLNIENLENEFNKKKILNFKYLIISILLIIIMNI